MTVSRCSSAPHIHPRSLRLHALAGALTALWLAIWQPAAFAQPAGATVIHGQAQFRQQGTSLTITTANGAGTQHSAIDWRSFSVPTGSTTHFEQPTVTSTSINRVTGGNPSQVLGTLSSNGRLVLVNPAGIAFGAGSVVDTAGFTASTLNMSDADALTGRLRFGAAASGAGPLSVDGRILARSGDVVLLATDLSVGSAALVQAPQGAVIVAAGQRVELTGRGLEGIVFEVAAPTDRVVNLGTLEGDAVGIFASQLQHSGIIRATTVSRVQDKLYLGTILKKDEDKEKEEKEKKEKEEKDKAEKDKNPDANGNGNANGSSKGNGNSNSGPGTGPISTDETGGTSGSGGGGSNSGSGSASATAPDQGSSGSTTSSGSGNTGTGGASQGSSTSSNGAAPAPVAAPASAPAAAPVQQAAARTVNAQAVDYQAPAVTPAQALNAAQEEDRLKTASAKKVDANDTSKMGAPAVCTP